MSLDVFTDIFRSNEIVAVVNGYCYESSDDFSPHHLWIGRSKIHLQKGESINELAAHYFASSETETVRLQKDILEQESLAITPLEHFIFVDFFEKSIHFEKTTPCIRDLLKSVGPQDVSNYLLIDGNIHHITRATEGQLVVDEEHYALSCQTTTKHPNNEFKLGLYSSAKEKKTNTDKQSLNEVDNFRKNKRTNHGHYTVSCEGDRIFFERKIPSFISRFKGAYYHFPKVTIRHESTLQKNNEKIKLETMVCANPNTYVHPFVYRKLSGEICNNHRMPWNEETSLEPHKLTYSLNQAEEREKAALFIQTYLHISHKTITQGYSSDKIILAANTSALQYRKLVAHSESQAKIYARINNISEGDFFGC